MYLMVKKKNNGFTLVEIMVVIAIIGLLAVVLIPKIGSSKDSAKDAGVLANVRAVQAAIEQMNLSINLYNSQDAYNALYNDLNRKLTSLDLVNPYTGSKTVGRGEGTDFAVSVHETGFADTRRADVFDWDHFDDGLWGHYVPGGIYVALYKTSTGIEIGLYDMSKNGPLSPKEKIVRIKP